MDTINLMTGIILQIVIEKELKWERTYTFERGIKETVDWYLNNEEWIDNIKSGEYQKSYKKQNMI